MASGEQEKSNVQAKPAQDQEKATADTAPQPPAPEAKQESAKSESAAPTANQPASDENVGIRPSAAEWLVRAQTWCAIAQVVLSVCLVIFTAGQMLYGYRQWDATNNQYSAMVEQNKIAQGQVEIARGQLEQAAKSLDQIEKQIAFTQVDQRPWLGVTEAKIGGIKQPTSKTPGVLPPLIHGSAEFRLTNSGKTPARIISRGVNFFTVDGNYTLDAEKIIDGAAPSELEKVDEIVPPGGSTDFSTSVPSDFFGVTLKRQEEIVRGRLEVWVAGIVHYQDSAGNPGHTEWCYRYWAYDDTFLRWRTHNVMR